MAAGARAEGRGHVTRAERCLWGPSRFIQLWTRGRRSLKLNTLKGQGPRFPQNTTQQAHQQQRLRACKSLSRAEPLPDVYDLPTPRPADHTVPRRPSWWL